MISKGPIALSYGKRVLCFNAIYGQNSGRTKSGVEVDFVLDAGNIAIDVKIARRVDKKDFLGLATFADEHKPKRLILICLEDRRRKMMLPDCEIEVIPVLKFFDSLWAGEIL